MHAVHRCEPRAYRRDGTSLRFAHARKIGRTLHFVSGVFFEVHAPEKNRFHFFALRRGQILRSKIEKAPKTCIGLWDRNKLYPAVPPKLACSPLVPCHHTAGAVTGAIPGVSFAPLLSPFPEPSAAALSAYAPLSEDFVSRVLLSVIGFTHLA